MRQMPRHAEDADCAAGANATVLQILRRALCCEAHAMMVNAHDDRVCLVLKNTNPFADLQPASLEH